MIQYGDHMPIISPTQALRSAITRRLLGVLAVWALAFGAAAQDAVTRAGTIAHFALSESSGLAASRRYPGVIWSHNDATANPHLFAMRRDGTSIRAFPVSGARFIDWEDLGIDSSGNLYIADIGANGMGRSHVAIHRVREPNPFGRVRNVGIERSWLVRFPGTREDCEAFFVSRGFGYLVTKQEIGGTVTIYGFPLAARGRSILLRRITTVDVAADVTGASISRDAARLALLTDEGPIVYMINGNVAGIRSSIGYYRPWPETSMEGATFVGDGLLVGAENRDLWFFTDPPFRAQ
jgi:hypothetical protein